MKKNLGKKFFSFLLSVTVITIIALSPNTQNDIFSISLQDDKSNQLYTDLPFEH